MTFCDAQRLLGFGPCETNVNNIIYNYIIPLCIKIIHYFMKKVQNFFGKSGMELLIYHIFYGIMNIIM